MPSPWEEQPGGPAGTLGPAETLESAPDRRSLGLLALAVAVGLLIGAAGAHEAQRRQAQRAARTSIAVYGLFDSAETPVVNGTPDVSAGLRVYNAGPLPLTVAGLALTGSGLAAAGTTSQAPVRIDPGSASLALAMRSDCSGRDGRPLTVTATIGTADGRTRRTEIPLDHYSDGYLAVNAACAEARMQAAAPLPDIFVTVDSARVLGSGPRAVLRWRISVDGAAGLTLSALALSGRRLGLTPHGLPRTFGTPGSAPPLYADVTVRSCAAGALQPGDFLLTWTASRRNSAGELQQRLANINAVPPAVVLLTTGFAARACPSSR